MEDIKKIDEKLISLTAELKELELKKEKAGKDLKDIETEILSLNLTILDLEQQKTII